MLISYLVQITVFNMIGNFLYFSTIPKYLVGFAEVLIHIEIEYKNFVDSIYKQLSLLLFQKKLRTYTSLYTSLRSCLIADIYLLA